MSDLFSEFEPSTNAQPDSNEDPVADFLAREKVELDKIENNDDFSEFTSNNDAGNGFGNDIFGGGNDFTEQSTNDVLDANTVTTTATANVVTLLDEDDDGDYNKITSSEAPLDFLDGGSGDNNLNSNEDNETGPSSVYSAIAQVDRFEQEPEKIKRWREEQRERLAKKDQEEEQKKQELKEIARKELDDWYKNRQEQLERTHADNKAAEAELVAQRNELSSGQEWDRISKLCDFNPKANKNTKDVSRMRSILLQLKQQPLIRNAN